MKRIFDQVISQMHFGCMYSLDILKMLFISCGGKEKNWEKTLASEIASGRIIHGAKIKSIHYYQLDKRKVDLSLLKKKEESHTINILAQSILGVVLNETKKKLDSWIDLHLTHNLKNMIADEVEKEFEKEILPILLAKIDIRANENLKITKKRFRSLIKEILGDAIERMDQEGKTQG